MNTIAIVTDQQTGRAILQEFDESITVTSITNMEAYSYIGEVDHHKLFSYQTDIKLVYKQYRPRCYPILKKLQSIIFKSRSTIAAPIYAISYNSELDVLETLEKYSIGETVESFLNEPYDISLYEFLTFAHEIAQLLDSIELSNIVLRDLAPQNIILEDIITPTFVDYDAACIIDNDQYLNDNQLGTAGYASPEHFELNTVTTKSDIYSFGAILNQMIIHLNTDDFDYPKIEPFLHKLMLKMLSNDPDQRPNASSLMFIFDDLRNLEYDYNLEQEELEALNDDFEMIIGQLSF